MGDKSTGKTSLFNMLQRKKFTDAYTHTNNNTSVMVNWSFRRKKLIL